MLTAQAAKGSKMAAIIGYRVKVTLNDSRTLTGNMLAFDKHMNLVLSECEEFRRVKRKAKHAEDDDEDDMKRMLGLVILRGETVVTLSVEGPPPAEDESGPSVRLSRPSPADPADPARTGCRRSCWPWHGPAGSSDANPASAIVSDSACGPPANAD